VCELRNYVVRVAPVVCVEPIVWCVGCVLRVCCVRCMLRLGGVLRVCCASRQSCVCLLCVLAASCAVSVCAFRLL
jgi:hypothetical protein